MPARVEKFNMFVRDAGLQECQVFEVVGVLEDGEKRLEGEVFINAFLQSLFPPSLRQRGRREFRI